MGHRKLKKEITADGPFLYAPFHQRNSSSDEFALGGRAELQDLAFSAQQVLSQAPDDDTMPIDPALQLYRHVNDEMVMDGSPQVPHQDAVIFSVEDLPNNTLERVETSLEATVGPALEPVSPGNFPHGLHVQPNGSTEAPSSPHASRSGTRYSPLTPNAQRSGWLCSSAHKPSQTPHRSYRKSNTPKTPSGRGRDNGSCTKLEPRSETKARATSSALLDSEEDMASLALALQLQMEEHGLRRRSMV